MYDSFAIWGIISSKSQERHYLVFEGCISDGEEGARRRAAEIAKNGFDFNGEHLFPDRVGVVYATAMPFPQRPIVKKKFFVKP